MRCLLSVPLLLLSTAAWADVPRVATDIAPVHSLVAMVMDGVGAPDLTIPPGASPHSYAMRPSEARALASADLVVWVGLSLTAWLAEPIDTLAEGAVHLELEEVAGTVLLENRKGVAFEEHDHDDHEDHEDHAEDADHADHETEGHDDHGHAAGAVDPHMWLDPVNASLWLSEIARTLSEIDPDNATAYSANAAKAQDNLAGLQATLQARLTPLQETPFAVFHDAYHYFEARFGVEARAALSLSDGATPSAARLAEVRDVIAASQAVCVFTEPQFNPGLVAALQAQGQLNSASLDPLGAGLEPGPALYVSVLTGLTDAFVACLSDASK
jgi:zinc transport system substrate-binding protein